MKNFSNTELCSESVVRERLKNANLRATSNRICILQALEAFGEPMSHVALLERLGDFDRVTLYRILDAFVGAKLIHRVQGTDGVWRFCSHIDNGEQCPGGHPHLLCEQCGKMVCLTKTPLPHIDIEPGFCVTHKQMLILGICGACGKNTRNCE